jgi:antitoxin (DNA-binding transcriptional repressor) of toxin-antitoxin stability system
MSHMDRIGVRELRRDASAILRRVAAGETIQVTDRGRPVALMVRALPDGLERLEAEGMIRHGSGDLRSIRPARPTAGVPLPSQLISDGRDE